MRHEFCCCRSGTARWAAVLVGFLFLAGAAWAAGVRGTVRDTAGTPVAGARITLDGREVAPSGADGGFVLPPASGARRLVVQALGFARLERALAADESELALVLEPALRVAEDLVVRAVRAAEAAPVTQSEIAPERIAALAYGQEMPFLLARRRRWRATRRAASPSAPGTPTSRCAVFRSRGST